MSAQYPQAVVLDRDGVINEDSDAYIKSPEEWIPIPGSLTAIARLNQAKIKVFIASNQSGIARGLFNYVALHQIHRKMLTELEKIGGYIDGIYICPDLRGECRKPNTGMLKEIEQRSGISLKHAPLIGDSIHDIQAALTFGAQPILVRTGKGEKTIAHGLPQENILMFENLAGAVDYILLKR